MVLKSSSRYLTTSSFNTNENFSEEEEFNECDVVWSSSSPEKTTTIETTKPPAISLPTTTATGLSAALLSSEDPSRSPTSIQRKTTTLSPVSMIASSLTRGGDGPGLAGYYYYGGRKFHQSAPVSVPVWPDGLGRKRSGPQFGLGQFDEDDDELLDDYGEVVPPHEIAAQSHNSTSFSVCEGAGRTLKGRDLTTVRNAVFQKTGFL